jgi:serine/threonine protein phosphatase PrpC
MDLSECLVIGESVQGSTHLRDGKPNQDAIQWYPDTGQGLPLIVALADGHGNEKHFRSHIGAHLATKTAIDVLREFAEQLPDDGELMMVIDHLPAAVERRWKRAVDDHLIANPFDEPDGKPVAPIGEDPTRYIAYGTTLLSALVTGDFIIYLQLGDGDILTVSPSGEVERVIQRDPNLIANQTTSLCLPEARRHFRTQFHRIAGHPPAILILCTDGYANSFEEADFLKTGADYLHLIRTKGIEHVNEHLEQWLLETSQKGSGDDISVGIVLAAPVWEASVKDQELPSQLDGESDAATEVADNPKPPPAATRLKRFVSPGSLNGLQEGIRGLIRRATDTRRRSPMR